ncbi:cylicin-2-like isoform X2 [Drosophila novamexicana]|uniref:cylicin-2-like isoform X2 n=1 Tax=Drosophila novamexicana TaxID=47314 RepID=UPI0011E5C638|nr:cylicin-2-like isoform X2 [Drosophila novamexicana]
MGFDLERICCNPPSSSSSTENIFCNENFNKCSPCCCHSCCRKSFLNDHTYSILKRVCHKIIKSYNRQQCREKYTIFDGGNSINGRWSERQKDEKSCKEREVGEKFKKGKDRGENEKDDYSKLGKGRGDTRAKKDADESDPMKKLKKTGSGAKEDKTEKLDSLKKSKRGKKDADENDLVKKSKVPGTGERDDKINDDSLKSEKPRGREKKIGSDLKNARPSNSIADKENGKKGKEKANKKEKQTPLNETDLNAKSEIEKKGKKTNDEKGQGTKYKQAQHSEIEEPKFDKKSKNLDKKENTNIDAKKKNRKSNRDTTGAHERDSREPDKDQKYKLNRKGDIRSSRRTGQNIRNRKSGRTLSRGNSRSRLGKGIKGSKFIQDNRRSNINESYSRRPSRVDEVRTCDILRVHLEKRDLSRCIPNECKVCRMCIPNCMPCPPVIC